MSIGTAIFTAVSFFASVYGGLQSQKSAYQEADLQEKQGALALMEAKEEARRVDIERIKFRKKQKLAFLKSGVSLMGSPLLVLQETRREGIKEVEAIKRRGRAQYELSGQKANITRRRGRAELIGGIGQGFSSVVTSGIFEA